VNRSPEVYEMTDSRPTRRIQRSLAAIVLGWSLVACSPASTSSGSVPPSPTSGASPSAQPSASLAEVPVPPGRILFNRPGADGKEHYFTIRSDGTDEHELFTREECGCALWSTDGSRVITIDATGHGTFSLMTIRPDGTERVVVTPPIETLNLAPGAPSADGRWIAFAGWDKADTMPNSVYVGSPDLAELHLVTALPADHVSLDTFGITPDGSRIVFFADRGKAEHAEGDLFVVNADGTGLRQLNPPGTTHNFLDVAEGSVSPDGRRVAFGVEGRIYVADLDGGEAQPITDRADFVWAVSWSPTGEWIAYTRQRGSTSVISLVRPDGSDQKEIWSKGGSEEASRGMWSPNGQALVVLRGLDTQHDLWIMSLDGHFIGQVTNELADYAWFSWAPEPGS
jgi:Tol biopolymer transport system component